jgi:glycine cleavage system transcriptional repressor
LAHVAVTAVGADRPGIVAAVTKVLVERGCNLEDTSMAILRGQFAMMLVVDAPGEASADTAAAELEAALSPTAVSLSLVVTVRPLADPGAAAGAAAPPGDSWTVAVYGTDRPGIVYGVAALMAELGINIVDLTTRVVGSREEPVYTMLLDITVPASVPESDLRERLERLAHELAVECSLHPSEADIL